ncbi:hypothetical protein RHSP_81324 [Rhizobium freirei PRF 81]|uniref:Uncharacterized protein n=1 Tax=Rhizobium freirei PRF 81 TaxID=363754 RepID=N6V3M5_9HYPH|nr:hypothetical protein RHSP_81324 [Rhizobium freirei PRF 81]
MRLQLRDQIHVGRDHRSQHEIAAAGDGIAMQDDRLRSARHLDRTVGIAAVDDIRRIRAGTEGLLALDEFKLAAAAEAIAHAIGFRRHLPLVGKEIALRLLGQPIPVEPRQDPQLGRRARLAAKLLGNGSARAANGTGADWKLVAGNDRPTAKTTKCADDIGRSATQRFRNVDAARHRNADPRAGLQKVKAYGLPCLDLERRPSRLDFAIDPDRHIGAGDRDQRIIQKFELRPHEDGLQPCGTLFIADKEICRAHSIAIHCAADGNAEMEIAGPPEILNGGGKTVMKNLNGHAARPPAWCCSRRYRPDIGADRN